MTFIETPAAIAPPPPHCQLQTASPGKCAAWNGINVEFKDAPPLKNSHELIRQIPLKMQLVNIGGPFCCCVCHGCRCVVALLLLSMYKETLCSTSMWGAQGG